jgi:type I restriction enzyme M protein
MQPKPGMTINDPACGTGGFIIAAHDYISANHQMDLAQKKFLRFKTFTGKDIVDGVVRLCVMNLFLHGIDGEVDQPCPIETGDSLIADPGKRYSMVLTNPRLAESSITLTNGDGKQTKNPNL